VKGEYVVDTMYFLLEGACSSMGERNNSYTEPSLIE